MTATIDGHCPVPMSTAGPAVRAVPPPAGRLVLEVDQAFEKFRSRYEAAVPPADPRLLGDLTGRHARWPRPAMEGREPGPEGFVMYWRADLTPPASAAGGPRPCTGYLMGLGTWPETFGLDDPAVLLYSRLRAAIYIGPDDRTRFAVDQPSTVLASFADPAIAGLGLDLDQRLAGLLGTLGLPAAGRARVRARVITGATGNALRDGEIT